MRFEKAEYVKLREIAVTISVFRPDCPFPAGLLSYQLQNLNNPSNKAEEKVRTYSPNYQKIS